MRTMVVTGSASGLGAAIRSHLEDEGCRVLGVDQHEAEVTADLSTPVGRSDAMNEILTLVGGSLDGLVVCAGLGPHVMPRGQIVSVNYYGAVALLDGLRPVLAAGRQASAVAISSNSIGVTPIEDPTLVSCLGGGAETEARAIAEELSGMAVYAMTKIALAQAVRRRVMDWGRAGVRLNAVAPGPVLTPLLQGSIDDPELGPLVDALPIPIERRGEPGEIAAVVAFLLSRHASYVHGSVVFVDGGTDALVRPEWF